jgi:hypothetical protein
MNGKNSFVFQWVFRGFLLRMDATALLKHIFELLAFLFCLIEVSNSISDPFISTKVFRCFSAPLSKR